MRLRLRLCVRVVMCLVVIKLRMLLVMMILIMRDIWIHLFLMTESLSSSGLMQMMSSIQVVRHCSDNRPARRQ
jgi:hypothetical protein